MGRDQLEKFVLAHRSDATASFRAMVRKLRKYVEVLDAVELLMNHIPTARNIVSRDGDTIRPIEAMSAVIVSRRYYNHLMF
jgi:hypothetical protein